MKLVEVDLTILRSLTNNIISTDPIELKIIEFYKSDVVLGELSTIELFVNHVLNHMYRSNNNLYKYSELEHFFNVKRFLTTYNKFIVTLEYMLIKHIGIRFESICFSRIVNIENRLIVEFIVEE